MTKDYIKDFRENFTYENNSVGCYSSYIESWLEKTIEEVRGEMRCRKQHCTYPHSEVFPLIKKQISEERNRILNLPIMQEEDLSVNFIRDEKHLAEQDAINTRNSLRKEILKQVNK